MASIKTKLKLLTAAAIPAIAVVATWEGLKLREYSIKTHKVNNSVSFVLLSDLHGSEFGEGQKKLLKIIDKCSPDAVFLTGDIIDERRDYGGAMSLLEAIGKKYPCYYVPGNHEHRTGEIENIKKLFSSYGVFVLAGEGKPAMANGERIYVCGADEASEEQAFRRQLVRLNGEKDDSAFTVLMSHRPEKVGYYNLCNFDLVLCGHAHGGQVRIPHLLNGLYAPGQGVFPKYAGGEYKLDNGVMIVSRGLAKSNVPRIFNPPEVVKITLTPGTEGVSADETTDPGSGPESE